MSSKEVYLALLQNYDPRLRKYSGQYNRVIAVQKCGNEPHELAIRFAGCNLRCGACFASGYSWSEMFRTNRRVVGNISSDEVIEE